MIGGKRLSWSAAGEMHRERDAALEEMTQDAVDIDADAPWLGPSADIFDYTTISSWIADRECSEIAKCGLDIYFANLLGVETDRAGCLGMLAAIKGGGLDRFWTDSELYHSQGGNSQLAMGLATAIKQIELGLAVLGIDIGGEQVRIECTNDEIYEADEVVLAIPPTTWKEMRFSPDLPADLAPQMGANTKYISAFRERFWLKDYLPNSGTGDGRIQSVWEATAGYAGDGPAVLTAYSGANSALELQRSSPVVRKQLVTEAMEAMYPGYTDNVGRERFIDWIGDRFGLCGAYSCTPRQGRLLARGQFLTLLTTTGCTSPGSTSVTSSAATWRAPCNPELR